MTLEETKYCAECKNCKEVVKKGDNDYKIVCPYHHIEGVNEGMLHGTVYCVNKLESDIN